MTQVSTLKRRSPAIALIGLVLVLTSFSSAQVDVEQARAEGRVVVYSSFPAARLRPVLDAFEAAYPGIVAEQLFAQTGQAISRILAEHGAGRQGFDLLIAAWDPGYFTLAEAGALASYRSPAAGDYDEQWFGPDDVWLNIWGGAQVIGYNTSLVTDVPTSWQDLADPRFRGLVGIGTPTVRGGMYWLYYHLYELYGETFFQQLADNGALLTPGPSAAAEWITAGRVPIGVTTDFSVAEQKLRGAPVDWVYPSEGVFFQLRALAMAENAPHPSAARLFYDWLISESGGEIVVEALGLYSLNPHVGAPAGLPALVELSILETDLENFVAQEDHITDTATRLLGAE